MQRVHDAEFIPADYFREARREEIFPDASRALEIDLGCGDGTFLLAMAKHHPERDFLGVERMPGRYEKVARAIREQGLTNVRVLRLESSYTVGWLLPALSVTRLHLLCPDPWPKAGHARRRMVRLEEFQRGLARVLVPGGEFLLKTDDAVYFEDAQEQFDPMPGFTRAPWTMGDFFYAMTDFERHWLRLDRSIHRARWIRAA
jgi:tRNA (guanine-N7-)-methyltransferase